MKSFVHGLQDGALLFVRLAVGLLLLAHGWHRFHTLGMDVVISQLRAAQVPHPELCAWGATSLELVGGLFLVFGLLTPLVGLGMVVQNVLTIVWLKSGQGYRVTEGGWELNVMLGALGLIFLTFGAGKIGLDQLFRRGSNEPTQQFIDDNARV